MEKKMSYLTFVMAGIRNKPGRNIATIFCFAFIAANIFSAQYLIAGSAGSVDRGISRMGADFIIAPVQYAVFLKGAGPDNTFAIIRAQPSSWRFNNNVMDISKALPNISEVSPQLYVSTLNLSGVASEPVEIFGIDPVTDFTIQPWLGEPLEGPLGTGDIIVGNKITGDISSKIRVADRSYTIKGRLDPTQSAIDNTIFMSMDDAYALAGTSGLVPSSSPRIYPGEINAVLVRIKPGVDPDIAGARIKRAFPPSQITVIGRHFTLDPVSREIQDLPALLNIVTVIIIAAAFPLIALIAAMVTNERRREIGLLKSMGAKRHVVFSLVIAESLSLAVIGGISGVVISIMTVNALSVLGFLSSALSVSFRMPTIADTGIMAGFALVTVIAIGSGASLYPAYMSSRMNPYDAIRVGSV